MGILVDPLIAGDFGNIPTAVPTIDCEYATEQLLTYLSLQPQGRTRCHHHQGPLCRQEVCDHFSPRQRHKVAPLPPRARRRYRDLPQQGHPPHVKDQAGQEVQGQAFRQADQLYVGVKLRWKACADIRRHPLDAHPLHHRARQPQGRARRRHIQGAFATGGGQEDRQEGIRGAIPVRQEQVVLHSLTVLGFPSVTAGRRWAMI
jgi:hypothetical protein